MRRGSAVLIIIGVIAALFLLFSFTFPFLLLGRYSGGTMNKAVGGSPSGGCIIPDQFFTDTSLANNPDEVINKLKEKYGDRIPKVETNIRQVLQVGKEQGLNPAIVLAMWNGESSFRQDLLNSAFGFGNTDSGVISGTQKWEAQLDGIYSRLKKARDNESPYVEPKGTEIMTRLWYNYTTALKMAYTQANNAWVEKTSITFQGRTYDDPVGDRMVILRLLVPNQLQCKTATTYSGNGLSTCPNVRQNILPVNNNTTGTPRVVVLHYLGGKGSSDNQVFTIADMYNYSLRGIRGEADRTVYVHYVIGQDGTIEQQYPENRIGAGAMNYNSPTDDYGPGAIALHIENEGNFESQHRNMQYTQPQLQANISLVRCLQQKFSIAKKDVISHKEADRRNGVTGRRSDPGEKFMNELLKELQ